jgi:hypothetical protein
MVYIGAFLPNFLPKIRSSRIGMGLFKRMYNDKQNPVLENMPGMVKVGPHLVYRVYVRRESGQKSAELEVVCRLISRCRRTGSIQT